jgi:hypothetical protein
LLVAGLACVPFLAAPLAAQITISGVGQGGGGQRGQELLRQLNRVDRRIDRARDEDQLSRREARALNREARQIGALRERYARGGLSDAEAAELQFRISALNGQIGTRPQPAAAPDSPARR